MYYDFTTLDSLICSKNCFDGLKDGISCSGISIDVPFFMFLPIFAFLVFLIKEPNPLT